MTERCFICGRIKCQSCGGTGLGWDDEPCSNCKGAGWFPAEQCGPYTVSVITGNKPTVLCPPCKKAL